MLKKRKLRKWICNDRVKDVEGYICYRFEELLLKRHLVVAVFV